MYWQYEYLREGVTATRGQTYKEDLPENGLLSCIFLKMSAAGVSGAFAATENWRISDFITKIEIIGNGSEVIKSITGNQLQALQFFDTGIASLDYWHSYATGTQRWNCILNFGRYPLDPMYGLDLSRWNNVEIKITNNASSTYYSADFSLSMLCAYKRDGGGGFSGYFRTEEWRSWTTVANTWEYNDLPVENKIRRIVLQIIPDLDSNNVEETAMWNCADDIELALKTGVNRIYRGGIDDIMRMNAYFFKKLVMTQPQYYMTADKGRKIGIGYVLGGAWGSGAQDGSGSSTVPTLEGMRTSFTQKPESYEADSPIHALHVGICPENCVVFPFNYIDEPGEYLDPKAEESVQLNIHTRNAASAADGTISIILDRLV